MSLAPSKCSAEAIALHKSIFGSAPDFVSVAPGRVNLIGEHVDHQGYSVLPAALNHSIQIAVSRGTKPEEAGKLIFQHHKQERFPRHVFNSLEEMKVSKTPIWVNYAIAALFGVFEYATFNDFNEVGKHVKPNCCPEGKVAETARKLIPAGGIRVSVDGCVPEAAGVSSSSALVVGMTIAFMNLLGVKMNRVITATMCANSERHTGVCGGGMDQAAICLCKKGKARMIHFDPLATEEIPLPANGVLVVCNCGMESPKAVSAATCYNKRVFELKLACFVILRAEFPNEEISKEQLPTLTLRYVQEKLKMTRAQAAEVAKKHLKTTPTSKEQAEKILGEDRLHYLLNQRVGPAIWERNVFFEPLRRVLHVYEETDRVFKFAEVCRDQSIQEDKKLEMLGALLNASDDSMSLLFDCSSPELSEVCSLARKSGAYGSRLTGAGWGGCTVSLVHKDNLESFLTKMDAYFKRDRLVPINIYPNSIFAVFPGDGASVFDGENKEIVWE